MFHLIRLLVALYAFFSSLVFANDLGVIGKVYEITERDLLEVMHERMNQKMESGEMDQIYKGMQDDFKQYAMRPPGIKLPRATEYRATEISPLYTLDRDIVDADGKLLFKAGTQVNPLEVNPLTKALCFIDGDDVEQVEWMLKYCTNHEPNKLILVNGDVGRLMKELNRRLYFDQRQILVNKFEIAALPAVVRQSGTVLYVEEFPIK